MADFSSLPHTGPVEYAPREQASPERTEAESTLRRIPGVEGVGEGRDAIGDPAWVVYVRDRSVLSQLPAQVGGRPVVPEVSGEIGILPAR
jgi:hypothetical protein